jgi:hypothetical protein
MALPGAQALVQRGPIINVTVGLERSMATALIGQGAKVPIPVTGVALIDTCASVMCIDNSKAIELGLPVVDKDDVGIARRNRSTGSSNPR